MDGQTDKETNRVIPNTLHPQILQRSETTDDYLDFDFRDRYPDEDGPSLVVRGVWPSLLVDGLVPSHQGPMATDAPVLHVRSMDRTVVRTGLVFIEVHVENHPITIGDGLFTADLCSCIQCDDDGVSSRNL